MLRSRRYQATSSRGDVPSLLAIRSCRDDDPVGGLSVAAVHTRHDHFACVGASALIGRPLQPVQTARRRSDQHELSWVAAEQVGQERADGEQASPPSQRKLGYVAIVGRRST